MSDETKPVPAVKSAGIVQKTHAVKAPKPEGWFSFKASGMRAPIIAKIQASDIPDGWKAALAADINALSVDMNFVSVDAHRHLSNGKYVGHFCIAGKAVLA